MGGFKKPRWKQVRNVLRREGWLRLDIIFFSLVCNSRYILKCQITYKTSKFNFNCHTVWEAWLGAKKVSVVETVTVVKYMHVAIKICKN